MMNPYLQVALGGAVGSVLRFATTRAVGVTGFPAGTMIVNIVGSFLMGLIAAGMAQRWGNAYAPLLMTGVLGGFTTFSAFSLDTLALWEREQTTLAALYVAGSVAFSLIFVIAGMAAGRGLFA